MKKLFVAGCSFSNYTEVDKVYGEFASEKMGIEYRHLAGGCGSNDRSIRLIMSAILNGSMDPGDIIVYQPTESTRTEFASWSLTDTPDGKLYMDSIWPWVKHEKNALLEYTETNTVITRWKTDSHKWQPGKDAELHRAYEMYGTVYNHALEIERNKLLMLREFVNSRNINFTVLWTGYALDLLETYSILLDDQDIQLTEICPELAPEPLEEYQLHGTDLAHLSLEGHKLLGDRLASALNTTFGE